MVGRGARGVQALAVTALFPKLFGRDPQRGQAAVPDGSRVYAVGDVHGRLDLLDELLGMIAEDRASSEPRRDVLIFLGDLIDRGPDSSGVVERVRSYRQDGVRCLTLCGNHEEVLLRLLRGDGDNIPDWLRFGGAECARSYGIDPAELRNMRTKDAIELLRTAVPAEHQAFLQSLSDTCRIGGYLFVHAGIRPGIALEDQSQADLRWIRAPFLDHADDFRFMVVHGHTITESVDVRSNRIGIDTGAYRSGVLTALVLEGTERRFLQTGTPVMTFEQAAGAA